MGSKGYTLSCLEQYLGHLPWNDEKFIHERKAMAAFVGVQLDTIRDWYTKRNKPIGLVLVKIRYFLENQGYKVTELENLPRPVYILGKLIAEGKIDYVETYQKIGMKGKTELLKVLHGSRNLSGARFDAVKRICANFQAEFSKESLKIVTPKKVAILPPATVSPDLAEIVHLLCCVDDLTILLEPRLESILAGEVDAETRVALRNKVKVFELSNRFHRCTQLLNALCSEKAREIIALQKRKGGR
jgi:hypothetical protein